MVAIRSLALLGLSTLPFTQAWLLEFWASQVRCSKDGDGIKADTERGGVAGKGYCAMISLDGGPKAMKISEWDDGCKVSVYAGSSPCTGEPVWERFKEEMAEAGRLVDNDWTCVIGLEGMSITSAEYNCED
ncbi:hypothetical protein PG993_013667 [Apiospora rasikravindrae]|uniref:Uncharacterized protein n=1 Tax=Apiospora rasikravindrae TaxID=990691 RepID=A0ABR1RQU3_9PEZI